MAAAYGDPVLETSGESGIIEEPSGEEVLFSVLTPEQRAQYREAETEAWSYLTEEQRAWIEAGDSAGVIYSYLSDDQRQRIEAIEQALFGQLDFGQQTDFMFLSGGMLEGIDIATRKAILQFIKGNDGEITYEDLVDLGVYEPGTLAEGGFRRWLQNLDIGGPAHYGDLLGTEYRLNQYGTNFAKLDQEERMLKGAERTMLLALTAAPVVAAWVENRLTGAPGVNSPYGQGTYSENLEQFGTSGNFKTRQDYVPPLTGAGQAEDVTRLQPGAIGDLPETVQNTYRGYEGSAWKGNFSGQTPGTAARSIYKNSSGVLPKVDLSGNQITYKEFDVNNFVAGIGRDAERFAVGSDGSLFYTNDHYTTFIKLR